MRTAWIRGAKTQLSLQCCSPRVVLPSLGTCSRRRKTIEKDEVELMRRSIAQSGSLFCREASRLRRGILGDPTQANTIRFDLPSSPSHRDDLVSSNGAVFFSAVASHLGRARQACRVQRFAHRPGLAARWRCHVIRGEPSAGEAAGGGSRVVRKGSPTEIGVPVPQACRGCCGPRRTRGTERKRGRAQVQPAVSIARAVKEKSILATDYWTFQGAWAGRTTRPGRV